jgi:DNA-binding NarL/FixJ family response regulator
MSLSVVVAEHHEAVREGLVLLLEARGCTVAAATGSWRTGLALIERHAPDVALVGVELADGDGFTLARQALRADPGRRILLYADAGDERRLAAAREAGAQGYALKAGTPGELVDALAAVARGETYRDRRVQPPTGAPAGDPRAPGVLSRREGQVLELLSRGMTGEQVAEHLVLSAETVRTHVRNAMSKLHASTRVHAVAIALREGYIDGPGPAAAPAPAPAP